MQSKETISKAQRDNVEHIMISESSTVTVQAIKVHNDVSSSENNSFQPTTASKIIFEKYWIVISI